MKVHDVRAVNSQSKKVITASRNSIVISLRRTTLSGDSRILPSR